MKKKDEFGHYFEVLGLSPGAVLIDIQNAYRKLVLKYHPDVNHEITAPERFREVVAAYSALIERWQARLETTSEELFEKVKEDPVIKEMTFEELEKRLKYSSSSLMRVGALIALGAQDGEKAKRLIFDYLKDKDEGVRLAALKVLGKICDARDLSKIFMMLSSINSKKTFKHTSKTILQIMQQGLKEIFPVKNRVYAGSSECASHEYAS